jgi:nucleoside deoxyribosyltransferase
MGKKIKLYVAGADVFRANARVCLEAMKELGELYGFEVLTPFDNNPPEDLGKEGQALCIASDNFDLIDQCDVVVANLDSFRGAGIDDGTASEMGYGYGKNKMVCGYSSDYGSYKDKIGSLPVEWMDEWNEVFPVVEDFGLRWNLMIHAVLNFTDGFVADSFEDVLKKLVERYKGVL